MALYTTNYNLEKQQSNEYVNIEGINGNFDIIDSNIKAVETKAITPNFQTAGGTAVAITLTDIALVNGNSKTFLVALNNSGSATTINGIPLYKPNTTTAPTLTVGKAVTVWYNSTVPCFFIKASAEGNAIAANVLATKTFSNDNDTGLTGTMANFSGTTKQIVNHGSAMTVTVDTDTRMGVITMPSSIMGSGYVDSTTVFTAQLYDLIPSNIKVGAYVGQYTGYGTGYMAGTYTSDATATAAQMIAGSSAYVKGNKITGTMVNRSGVYQAANAIDGTYTAGRIYMQPPVGYYDGTGSLSYVYADDADFTSSNIVSTANIFGKQGTAVMGANVATGTVGGGGSLPFYFALGGTTVNKYIATVSGLTFLPSCIFINYYDGSNTYHTVYMVGVGCYTFVSYPSQSTNSAVISYQMTGNAYVNATGFQLPVQLSNVTYTWKAIG